MKDVQIISALMTFLASIAVYTFFMMIIWNSVLMPKIKGLNLQKLNFLDALAIGLFFSLASGSSVVLNYHLLLP